MTNKAVEVCLESAQEWVEQAVSMTDRDHKERLKEALAYLHYLVKSLTCEHSG